MVLPLYSKKAAFKLSTPSYIVSSMNRSVNVIPNLSPFFSLKKSMDHAYILVILPANEASTPSFSMASERDPSKLPEMVLRLF